VIKGLQKIVIDFGSDSVKIRDPKPKTETSNRQGDRRGQRSRWRGAGSHPMAAKTRP